ncbi:hypothetical protein AURDEDRAFT_110644 [Auricularia subglabra TFB-10046 SS5]|nr:hypothetical protein AURDEDRAFT_110644 [Auricularia subglabra TFB-10046 SS5]
MPEPYGDTCKPIVDTGGMPSFQMHHALRPQLSYLMPFFEPSPEPDGIDNPEVVPQADIAAPTYAGPPLFEDEPDALEPWAESDTPADYTLIDDLNGKELLDGLDQHFVESESLRRRRWKRIQDFYDACLPTWQERFQELQESLDSTFVQCTQNGTIGRIKTADETVRISVRAQFREAEARRIDELKRSWSRQQKLIISHHEDFVRLLEMAEDVHFDIIETRLRGKRTQKRRAAKKCAVGFEEDIVLPFSIMSIFRRPRTSQPLLTVSPSVQTRSAFEISQRNRDQSFEASLAKLRADARVPEAKRVDSFSTALFHWQTKAAAAERERTVVFERQMEATRTEWHAYHAQTSRTADDLIAELGNRFSEAQSAREEAYKDAVQAAHALVMGSIQELPQAYRALVSRMCDQEVSPAPL